LEIKEEDAHVEKMDLDLKIEEDAKIEKKKIVDDRHADPLTSNQMEVELQDLEETEENNPIVNFKTKFRLKLVI
jgi:hypothetical protein